MGGASVARLLSLTPTDGLGLPLEAGGVRLTAPDPGRLTLVAPFRGQQGAVSAALDRALGLGLPGPGETRTAGAARAIWFGRGQVMVMGPDISPGLLDGIAAVTDQSDGWSCLRLEGLGAAEVLARLTPLDLRGAALPTGATARTLLGHMVTSLTRTGPDILDLLVFRSMTGTAVHEITTAMTRRAARLGAHG